MLDTPPAIGQVVSRSGAVKIRGTADAHEEIGFSLVHVS
jgi:hypothetical protein